MDELQLWARCLRRVVDFEAWESNRLLAAPPSTGFAGYSPDWADRLGGGESKRA